MDPSFGVQNEFGDKLYQEIISRYLVIWTEKRAFSVRRLRGDDECVVGLRDDVGGIWVRVIMSVPSERDGAWAAEKDHLRKKFKSEIEHRLLWVCGDIEQFLLSCHSWNVSA